MDSSSDDQMKRKNIVRNNPDASDRFLTFDRRRVSLPLLPTILDQRWNEQTVWIIDVFYLMECRKRHWCCATICSFSTGIFNEIISWSVKTSGSFEEKRKACLFSGSIDRRNYLWREENEFISSLKRPTCRRQCQEEIRNRRRWERDKWRWSHPDATMEWN